MSLKFLNYRLASIHLLMKYHWIQSSPFQEKCHKILRVVVAAVHNENILAQIHALPSPK